MFGLLTKKRAKATAHHTGAVPSGRKLSFEPSVIASNVNVLGNMVSDGVLDIDGQVDGNVTAQMVTVRPNGRIRGDLMATEAIVHGTVDGLIKAHAVSLFSTAVVNGTIMHETLMIEDGAVMNGKLKRTEIAAHGESPMGGAAAVPLNASGSDSVSEDSVLPVNGSFVPEMSDDSYFDNDNDSPQSEKEIKILENLRLIS